MQPIIQAKEKRVLPIVSQLIEDINHQFGQVAGPLSGKLISENYSKWLNDGKIGPSSLRSYIHELSKCISNKKAKDHFVEMANKTLLQVQTGPKTHYRHD